jgi:hypothetical protein
VAGVRRHLFDVLTPEQVRQLGQISAAVRDGLAPAASLPDGAEGAGSSISG